MEVCVKIKKSEYIGRFNLWKKKTAQSFIEMGKVVVDAKECLSKAEYAEFIGDIGYSTASAFISKLYQIGLHADIFEKHIDLLPSSFTTIYALTSATDQQLEGLFESNVIHPTLKGKDIARLVNRQKRYRVLKRNSEHGPVTITEGHAPLTRLDPIEVRIDSSVPLPQLAQFIRQLDLLTRFEGIQVSLPEGIRQQLTQECIM